jgi:hypothetical protein
MGFVLDVAGYGARTAPLQSEVQRRLPALVAHMLRKCGMDFDCVEHEWTGDGINAVLPADMDPTVTLPTMIRSLAAQLGADNARSSDRIRLRMAVGVGLIEHSAAGFGGPMVLDINRLVDSTPLRAALVRHPAADLVVAISDQVHSTVIRPGYLGIPSGQFNRVHVVAKEFSAPAWIWISARQWSVPAYQPLTMDDPRHIGGYRIAARLGSGPATRAYLASTTGGAPDGTPGGGWVAVKVFGPCVAGDAEARRRLEAGVLAASALRGAALGQLIESDTVSARPWLARTLVPGPTLASAVGETGPLPASSAAWLALGVARALATIREAGAAHEAITASNVLLSVDGPVVTDLGVSRNALIAGPADEAEDVFALGCLTFYAAVGRTPFGNCPDHAVCAPAARGEPDLYGCPADLLPIVEACLARDQGLRPRPRALISRLTAMAGQPPRCWLPTAIAARCADYQQFPDLAAEPRPRARLGSLLSSALHPGRLRYHAAPGID